MGHVIRVRCILRKALPEDVLDVLRGWLWLVSCKAHPCSSQSRPFPVVVVPPDPLRCCSLPASHLCPQELRSQFSKVRSIAVDVLPQHVVDTLMRLPTRNMDRGRSGGDDDERQGNQYQQQEEEEGGEDREDEGLATAVSQQAGSDARSLASGDHASGQGQGHCGGLGLGQMFGAAERLLQMMPQSFEEDLRLTPARGSASSARSGRSGLAAFGLPSRTGSGATVVTSTDVQPGSDVGGGQALLNFSQPGTPGSTSGGMAPPGTGGVAASGGGVISAAALALGHIPAFAPGGSGSGSGSGSGAAAVSGASVSSPASKSRSRSADLPVLTAQAALRRAPTKRRSALGADPAQAEYAEEHPRACILFAGEGRG